MVTERTVIGLSDVTNRLVHYKPGVKVVVNNKMQTGYSYVLSEPHGKNFADDFKPELTPAEMLKMGVFEGKYLRDCNREYPSSWFAHAKFAFGDNPDPSCNFFKVKSRMYLSEWDERNWITPEDPRGWFEWYCRYWLGRRLPEIDKVQIKRWNAFRRHVRQIEINCKKGDLTCRPRQRQAILQWAYNPLI